MAKTKHPADAARDAALEIIKKIADRAVILYDQHNVRVERRDVIMDLMACHFTAQKLRLDDLLAADDMNFATRCRWHQSASKSRDLHADGFLQPTIFGARVTVNHPHAMLRTGTRTYTKRPPANCMTARLAWDYLAKDGPIVWMTLLDGYWGCERPDGSISEAENVFSSRYR